MRRSGRAACEAERPSGPRADGNRRQEADAASKGLLRVVFSGRIWPRGAGEARMAVFGGAGRKKGRMEMEPSGLERIEIEVEMGEFECEDCGGFRSGSATIRLEDGFEAEVGHDGHFGAEWDGEEDSLKRIAVGLLGFEARIGGKEDESLPRIPGGGRDASGSELWVPAHELWAARTGRPSRVVEIEVEDAGDDKWYPTPLKARWQDPAGRAQEHVFDCGDWRKFWIEWADSLAEIDVDWSRIGD